MIKSYYDDIKVNRQQKYSYEELLSFKEWHKKRDHIRSRDQNICQKCKNYCADDLKLVYANSKGDEVWKPATWEEVIVETPIYDAFGEIVADYDKRV